MTGARNTVIGFALFCLSACGSNEIIEDHYYSLVLAAGNDVSTTTGEETSGRVIVGPIQLPSYLSTRGLAMQVGPNKIESARHHLWAEPLDEAIAKVLVRDIAQRTDGIIVEREAGRWTNDANCRLRVEFDAFHATNNSQVVTRGRYWVASDGTSAIRTFDYERSLTVDGYAHAVDVLRGTLEALAEKVADDVQAACTDRRHSVGDIPQRLENTRDNALAEP